MVMQDWWWCVRCDRVYGMLEIMIVSDVYPSLACRIPTHVADPCTSRSHWLDHAVSITTGTTSCTAKFY